MKKHFIPANFTVPQTFATSIFYFRVLEESVAELDFNAVMSSHNRLRGIFGPNTNWPKSDMSLDENIASLKVHKQEFINREAFAYSVFNIEKNKCLGSVYIDPSQANNYDCDVYLWIRDDSISLDSKLYETVEQWLTVKWPFSKIAFPGRNIVWDDWAKEL